MNSPDFLILDILVDRRQRRFIKTLFDRVKNDAADNDHAAENRPNARAFAEEKKNPDRIQKRFDKTDNARVQAADAARDAGREKNVGDADLKNPEIQNRENIIDARLGRFVENERQHKQNDQQIAVKDRERRIPVFEVARMAQKDEIQTEENARGERGDVAQKDIRREFIGIVLRFEKKQAHPGKTDQNRDQIRVAEFFLEDKRRKNQDIDRRGVLQKDRVGGGRRFVRVNKTRKRSGVENRRPKREKIEF